MIQPQTSPKAAFWFTETIESSSQEAPSTPVVRSNYTQSGLYFVDAQRKAPQILRTLSQFIMSPPFIAKFRSKDIVPLLDLQREHEKRWFSTRKPFGLEIPIPIETNITNSNARIRGQNVPLSLPALHMPTVTPAFPADFPMSWPASITVKFGFAKLTLDYTVAWNNEEPEAPTATMTFTDQTKSASAGNLSLSFKPLGAWTTTFDPFSLEPTASTGKIQYIATGTIAGKQPTEVLNLKLAFTQKLVQVAKTQDRVVTQPWASTPL